MKIILFGDSLLARMSKGLINSLEAKIPNSDIYNCAVGGWDTDDGLRKAPYIAQLKPDIVILGFGTNDAAPWKQVSLDRFLDNISKIINEFAGSRIIFFLPPPVHPQNGHNSEHRRLPEVVKQYHDEAKKLLEKLEIDFLDSHATFQPLLDNDEQYHMEDGVHLNEHGYEILIRELGLKIVE